MFRWKKAAAVLAAAAMTAAGVGCTAGSGTAYAMTIDGVQVNAGIYIYYSYASYMELTQTLQSENSELDVSDKDVVKEQKMDGVRLGRVDQEQGTGILPALCGNRKEVRGAWICH